MTFFSFQRVAEGYANHRPYYHPVVISKVSDKIGLNSKLDTALDVGCGTGLSTLALRDIANRVVGTDSSEEMISVARSLGHDDIEFQCSAAEELHFSDKTFDLITVCGAINWIDRDQFLPEAKRVLKPNGRLIVYDNFIAERMQEQPIYTNWYQDQYVTRFPKPKRDETPMTQVEAELYGFHVMQEEYTNKLPMSTEQYIEFMLTQSNVIAAVDMGSESLSDAREWMNRTLAPIFPRQRGTFLFEGYIWYLQSV